MRQSLSAFALLFTVAAFAEIPLPPGAVTTGPIDKVEVRGELTADRIREVPLIREATVFAPKFVFTEDFGYGTEILPDLRITTAADYTFISQWICRELGYGKAKRAEGTRANPSQVLMGYMGEPGSAKAVGLTIKASSPSQVHTNLVCALK